MLVVALLGFSFASLSPSQPFRRYAFPSFTLPLPCRSVPISALACQSKARVTTPLPILALLRLCLASPGRAVHRHRVAYPCLSVANIASHAAAKPAYSLPLRSTSNLYSAVATNCIPKPLLTQHCTTKPLLRYAAPSHALATHSSRSPCRTLRCSTTPLLRFATPRRCRSMPFFADHCHASPSRYYAVHRLSVAFRSVSKRFLCSHSLSKPSL